MAKPCVGCAQHTGFSPAPTTTRGGRLPRHPETGWFWNHSGGILHKNRVGLLNGGSRPEGAAPAGRRRRRRAKDGPLAEVTLRAETGGRYLLDYLVHGEIMGAEALPSPSLNWVSARGGP